MKARWLRPAIFILAAAAVCLGADPPGSAAADDVLSRWADAEGGLWTLKAVQTYEIREEVEAGSPAGRVERRVLRASPNFFRDETANADGSVLVQASDGLVSWESNDRLGAALLTPAAAASLLLQDNIELATQVQSIYPRRRLVGQGVFAGRRCAILSLFDRRGNEERWYLDEGGGQLLHIAWSAPNGGSGSFDFSDFRRVGDLVLPFVSKLTVGAGSLTFRWQSLTLNPEVDRAVFILSTARLRQIQAANAILAKNLAAAGDIEAKPAIRSRVIHLLTKSLDAGWSSKTTIWIRPPLIAIESEEPGVGPSWEGFDGTSGWYYDEIQGYRPLKPEELPDLFQRANFRSEGLMAQFYPLRQLAGTETIGGRSTHAVRLATLQEPVGTYYFDDETGHVVRIASARIGDSVSHFEATLDFSDYRAIDGIEVPFAYEETTPSDRQVTTITSIEDNVAMDPAVFKPRRDED